jgi:methylphosphotriester-DNA--protein-cysteine methyltransferase
VTPKRFARIHRFRFVLDALHRAPRPLSTLALDAGYYDQAHMNGEFRSLARMTPREYLRAARYPGSASIAEGPRWE